MIPSLMSDAPWVELHYTDEQIEAYVHEATTQLNNEWARRLGGVLDAVYEDLEYYRSYAPHFTDALDLERGIYVAKAWAEHGKDCKNSNCPVKRHAGYWGLDKEDKEEDEEV